MSNWNAERHKAQREKLFEEASKWKIKKQMMLKEQKLKRKKQNVKKAEQFLKTIIPKYIGQIKQCCHAAKGNLKRDFGQIEQQTLTIKTLQYLINKEIRDAKSTCLC